MTYAAKRQKEYRYVHDINKVKKLIESNDLVTDLFIICMGCPKEKKSCKRCTLKKITEKLKETKQ
jgi:hypothetical protein